MHSFDDRDLISGHGTLGLEILEDVPEADIVLVCCGGGGLVAGVAAAVKAKKKEVKVYAVEPELSNGMYKSLEASLVQRKPVSKYFPKHFLNNCKGYTRPSDRYSLFLGRLTVLSVSAGLCSSGPRWPKPCIWSFPSFRR